MGAQGALGGVSCRRGGTGCTGGVSHRQWVMPCSSVWPQQVWGQGMVQGHCDSDRAESRGSRGRPGPRHRALPKWLEPSGGWFHAHLPPGNLEPPLAHLLPGWEPPGGRNHVSQHLAGRCLAWHRLGVDTINEEVKESLIPLSPSASLYS